MTARQKLTVSILVTLITGVLVPVGAMAANSRLMQFLDPAPARHSVDPSLFQALGWRNVGPWRGGRVTAVAGVRGQPYTYYMGATGGGVWKTTNGGVSWKNISDGFFRTGTIGAIAVARSDSNIIYVGTGEAPVRGVTTSHGDGVYRSDDGGRTWRHIGLEDSRQIGALRIDPRNPDIAWVAVQGSPWAATSERGVYRTTDGGTSWKKVLFVNKTTGASYLSMDPRNSRILYAAMWDHRRRPWTVRSGGPGSGLYKSTDGGDHWRPINSGLPALMGNTSVTVSPANPDRLYAMIEATEGGVFRSDNGGASWRRVNGEPGIRDRGWYYTHIFADPIEENTVYVLAAPMMRSTDGGATFEEVRTRHGDNHDLWINPDDNRLMIEGNDGGAHVSFDRGKSWSRQDNQPTAQIYRVIADNLFPYNLYGGQQDNSSIMIASRTTTGGIGREDWRAVSGGESAFTGIDRDNPEIVYGTSLLGSISSLNMKTGERRNVVDYPYFAGFRPGRELRHRFNWNAPVVVSRHDPKVIYHAAQMVLKSTDRGQSWAEISPDLTGNEAARQGTTGGPIQIEGAGGEHYSTLTYLIESPHDAKVLWTGADDGTVSVTRDGGKSWQNVTPKDYGEAQVNAIDVSPHNPAAAYIAVTAYKFNDFTPLIYRTTDFGRHWTKITRGIADGAFVRVVREDPAKAGLLYAGTEAGMYVSFDDGGRWQPLQLNLPPVPVTDLTVHDGDLVASTQGRGFWILDDLGPLRQLTPAVAKAAFHLYRPSDALRLDRSGFSRKPGRNPPNGAVIAYNLGKARGPDAPPISLDILDSAGQPVRHFSSARATAGKRVIVKGVQAAAPVLALPTKAGMNRYVWNLRRPPMVASSDIIRYVSQQPYRIAPGLYTARLTVDGASAEATFKVRPDPRRAPVDEALWARQQAVLSGLYEMVNAVHATTSGLRAAASQAAAIMERTGDLPAAAAIARAGQALIDAVAAWEIHVPQADLPNGVQDRVSFPSRLLSTQILNVISAVDQDPPVTKGAERRTAELVAQWAALDKAAAALRAGPLADFNALLRDKGVPNVIIPE